MLRSLSPSSSRCSQGFENNICGNKFSEARYETSSSETKKYTERDRLTLSSHSSLDYNRSHVKLLLNSPSSEILSSIVHSGTSNSLKNQYNQNRLSCSDYTDKEIGIKNEADNIGLTGAKQNNGNGNQKWKSVKAVMAYYCTLRRIKRNGLFSITFNKCTYKNMYVYTNKFLYYLDNFIYSY